MKPFIVVEPFLKGLPAGWAVHRLRRVAALIEDANSDAGAPLLSLTIGGELLPRAADVQPPSAEYLLKYGLVNAGDLVVNPMWLTGGSIGVSAASGAVSPEYRIYRFGRDVHPRFIHHLVRSDPFMHQYRLLVRAETTFDRRVTKEDFKELPLVLPPIEVQCAIADYLDAETARIDALIAKKQRMIELLERRVESLIAEVLEPLVSRWGEAPLKAIAVLDVSNIDKKSYDGQSEVRLCNYTDVYYNRTITAQINFMAATADARQIQRLTLRRGDVVITKDSETADDIAVPAWVGESLQGVVLGYHLALLRPLKGDGRFLYWAIRSRRCRDAFSLAASGVTRVGLRRDEMARVRVPFAPLNEQLHAAQTIEKQVAAQEAAVDAVTRQINLLREHRQALITAAVTGELEIPGVAA